VDIVNCVEKRLEGRQVKAEHKHPAGLLRPHAILESTYEVISTDFTVELPLTVMMHDSIVPTVETLMKSSYFVHVRMMHHSLGIARVIIEIFLDFQTYQRNHIR
jgi:hypothetical protein